MAAAQVKKAKKMKILVHLFLIFLPIHSFADKGITFIVNKDNPSTSIGVHDLVDYYEKRKRQWPDGTAVKFIDREEGSPERKNFLNQYLKLSESEIALYWYTQKLHTGDSVPIKVHSDALVIELVKSLKGGIGYISSSIPIDTAKVKPIKVSE